MLLRICSCREQGLPGFTIDYCTCYGLLYDLYNVLRINIAVSLFLSQDFDNFDGHIVVRSLITAAESTLQLFVESFD